MSDPIARLNAALEGRYRIERTLGEGGMATVYLAGDLKHERKVALKVLKPELAAVVGAERFLAEIKTTANLQHPNILPLFDSGAADSFLFYVMPYVEGETLREKLDREHQLPVEEAVRLATDVAEALDHAHRQGVVHRDIKPGNILLRDGRPLIADFGIALAVGVAGGGRMTETGLSLGTPHYMSPEQATGDQTVGAATDIYALGCVLYEMLVGDPPYLGSTAQAILGKIIAGEIASATTQRRSVPPNVDAAIRRALEKLPADRFASAQDFSRALANPAFRYGEGRAVGAAGGGPWNRVTIGMAAVAGLFVLSTGWLALRPEPEPVRHVERFAPLEATGFNGFAGFDLSPDGTMLVYRAGRDGGNVLMVRRWDDLTATVVRESDGATAPAISFDGLELAFQQQDELKILSFAGGPIRTVPGAGQPEWGPDGSVYASTDSGVVRIPPVGPPEYVYRHADGENGVVLYDVLPDGRHALLWFQSEIRGLDLRTGDVTPITAGAVPRYVPSGHLVYGVDGPTMMAARFDPERMELLGAPVAVMQATAWSLADDGKLFYSAPSVDGVGSLQLASVTREGQPTPLDPDWTFGAGPEGDPRTRMSLSPDGSTVALREYVDGGYDIWLKEIAGGAHRRLTFEPSHERMPVWEPSGRNVAYLSDANGNFDVWRRAADGRGQPELVLDLDEDIENFDWSPDGKWLALWTAGDDIYGYQVGEAGAAVPLLAEEYSERDPAISPDGRWIAYVSDQTGARQVYVKPFPNVDDGIWQISERTSRYPRWDPSGAQLYFEDDGPQPSVWVVEYTADDRFLAGAPSLLFDAPNRRWVGSERWAEAFEVAPDGQSFILPLSIDAGAGETNDGPPFVLVNNFFEVLNQLAP